MEKSIKFSVDDGCLSIGRDNLIKQSGVKVSSWEKLVYIEPITFRGDVGNCRIMFPLDKLDEVISALQDLRSERQISGGIG
jgi:hypothetical protein